MNCVVDIPDRARRDGVARPSAETARGLEGGAIDADAEVVRGIAVFEEEAQLEPWPIVTLPLFRNLVGHLDMEDLRLIR